MANIHKPFHQKYRPNNLDELVGQKFISITLKQALSSQKIAPAYLFNGPRGTGKTSSARIFAKSLNCLSSTQPTADPCGKCELCKQISDGTALDIIEIDEFYEIITNLENFNDIREKFSRKFGDPDEANIIWKSKEHLDLNENSIHTIFKLINALDDCEDVQNVFYNFEFDEKSLQTIEE